MPTKYLINWENDDKGRRKVRFTIPKTNVEVRCTVINEDNDVGLGTGGTEHPAIKNTTNY